jgi:hypothetical protein
MPLPAASASHKKVLINVVRSDQIAGYFEDVHQPADHSPSQPPPLLIDNIFRQ